MRGSVICPRHSAAFCACIITNSMKICVISPASVWVWTSAMDERLRGGEQRCEGNFQRAGHVVRSAMYLRSGDFAFAPWITQESETDSRSPVRDSYAHPALS